MEWDIYNSNNERSFLKANGPYRVQTTGSSIRGFHYSQVSGLATSITIGEGRIYGTAVSKQDQVEKRELPDIK